MSLYALKGILHEVGSFQLQVEACRLEAGNIYCVAGPNGSGKTTLLRLLAFLDTPSGGTIEFRQQSLSGSPSDIILERCRRQVGFLMQNPYLFRMRVDRNVGYGLRVRGVPAEQVAQRVDSILSELGLSHLAGRRADRLSGGEAQRVALARVLALRPAVLLLDEPTANVDRDEISRIEQRIRQAAQDQNATVVFTTHSEEQASRLATHHLSMLNGRLYPAKLENVFTGSIKALPHQTVLMLNADQELVLPKALSRSRPTRTVSVNPRRLRLLATAPAGHVENVFRGPLSRIELNQNEVRLRIEGPRPFWLVCPQDAFAEKKLSIGQPTWLQVPVEAIELLD